MRKLRLWKVERFARNHRNNRFPESELDPSQCDPQRRMPLTVRCWDMESKDLVQVLACWALFASPNFIEPRIASLICKLWILILPSHKRKDLMTKRTWNSSMPPEDDAGIRRHLLHHRRTIDPFGLVFGMVNLQVWQLLMKINMLSF